MTRPYVASVRAWGLALVLSLTLTAGRAGADPPDEGLLFNQLAGARAQNRLGPLTRSAELDAIARRHASRMAASPKPFHNTGLLAETPGWLAVGEVVGRITAGPGWDSRLQQLFLSSPTHRRVTLSGNFTMVGIGTARGASGDINAVEVFGRPSDTRPPRAPRAARATGPPAARRALPPTTAAPPPPTTTTTVPLSKLALAPLPGAPPATRPPLLASPAAHARSGPSAPLTLSATAAELAALGVLVSVASASRSRRAGRRRPSC